MFIHKTKKYLLISLVAVAIVMSTISTSNAENYISANGGIFLPGSDYPDDFDIGVTAGGSYIIVNEYTGLEFGLNGTTVAATALDEEVTTIGAEMLVHFHKEEVTFQPFIAFGMGWYNTYYSIGSSEEKYSGAGTILKVGLRIFMSERFFAAFSAKHYTNRSDSPFGKIDLGGNSINVEIGLVTF